MKRSLKNTLAGLAIGAATFVASTSANAEIFSSGERIVSSHVVSDNVISSSDSSYVGDLGSSVVGSGSYVGDLPSGCGNSGCGGIGPIQRGYGSLDLFYNYYTQGNANRSNAQMYISPIPVPPNVGHTFFTYQPFYPEEMLYPHKDRFHNYYDNGRGMNRTRSVHWYPPVKQAASNFYWNFLRLPR